MKSIVSAVADGCMIFVLFAGAGGGTAAYASGTGSPLVLDSRQLDAVSAGGASLVLEATASATGNQRALALASSSNRLISRDTRLSQVDVVAGAAVALGVGDTASSARTRADPAVDNSRANQSVTAGVSGGTISISVTPVTAIGIKVLRSR